MFNKKLLLILASSMLLVACGTKPAASSSDGQDYEQASSTDTEGYQMYIVGSHWNSWTPGTIKEANPSCTFQKVEGSPKLKYDATITQAMVDAWCGFKFIAGASWNEQYGLEDIDIENCNDAFKTLVGYTDMEAWRSAHKEGTSNRSNVVVTAPGTLHIEYDPINFKTDSIDGTSFSYHFVLNFTAVA